LGTRRGSRDVVNIVEVEDVQELKGSQEEGGGFRV
jgi:hypothetical protein